MTQRGTTEGCEIAMGFPWVSLGILCSAMANATNVFFFLKPYFLKHVNKKNGQHPSKGWTLSRWPAGVGRNILNSKKQIHCKISLVKEHVYTYTRVYIYIYYEYKDGSHMFFVIPFIAVNAVWYKKNHRQITWQIIFWGIILSLAQSKDFDISAKQKGTKMSSKSRFRGTFKLVKYRHLHVHQFVHMNHHIIFWCDKIECFLLVYLQCEAPQL